MTRPASGLDAPSALAPTPRTYRRWIVCALLFFATTINYIDRQIIGILKPTLEAEFHWSEVDYGNIVFAFQVAYAAGYCLGGRLMDVIGLRIGYALAVVVWSLAAMGHALMGNAFGLQAARWLPDLAVAAVGALPAWAGRWLLPWVQFGGPSVVGFQQARFLLGLAEGGNFPAAVKTVSEWFPKRERALATGIFNAGSNVGALLTPLLVPWLTLRFGWPMAFVVTGALGFVWLVAWLTWYRPPAEDRRVSAAELDLIRSDPPDPPARIPWLALLRHRPTWAFAVGMFLSSPIWWMYLFWVPDFLHKQHGLDLKTLGPPLVVIYLMTDVGSVGGGWLSSWLIQRGWSVNAGRKTALLVCALLVVPVSFAAGASNLWVAVGLIGLAASAHQGWSANLYTLVSDTMPRASVSSVVGIGGMAGAIGGMFIAKFMGYVLETTGSYTLPFLLPPFAYLTALAIIHVLVPRLDPPR